MMSGCVNLKVLFNDIPMYCKKKIDLLYSDEWFRVGITIAPLLLHLVYFLSLMSKAIAPYVICIIDVALKCYYHAKMQLIDATLGN